MVYSAWLCCVVLSTLENLCGVLKLPCSSLPLNSLLSVSGGRGEKREREISVEGVMLYKTVSTFSSPRHVPDGAFLFP
ncbi:hypothetical protein ACRRTK_019525 [Alexandromys fortis]